MIDEHHRRVFKELRAAGVTEYGMRKFAIKYLPNIIQPDEQIMAVVYGRYHDKGNGAVLNAGVLVATDKRIVFLDYKPGFKSTDDITYEVVSGVNSTWAIFSSVTLYTTMGDYKISYANAKCAKKFVDYVAKRCLETKGQRY